MTASAGVSGVVRTDANTQGSGTQPISNSPVAGVSAASNTATDRADRASVLDLSESG